MKTTMNTNALRVAMTSMRIAVAAMLLSFSYLEAGWATCSMLAVLFCTTEIQTRVINKMIRALNLATEQAAHIIGQLHAREMKRESERSCDS